MFHRNVGENKVNTKRRENLRDDHNYFLLVPLSGSILNKRDQRCVRFLWETLNDKLS
jgi:hypothetical protein